MWESTKRTNNLICVLLCFLSGNPCLSIGGDTLSRGQSLSVSGTQTLISKDGIFELGFFTPGSNSSQNTYLGIWYKDFPERTTVWVANREAPLGQGSTLEIAQNGNLVLMSRDSDAVWSTNLMSTLPETVEAVLLDSGNLILRDGLSPSTVLAEF
ncbi:UNVERIFIED_CONTAM: S-locus-specific glycoprotein S13 [Sesamum radiatum]|uniref:non-specific serine/threonine protein kinase n=1 Tax=Sesamum radiatum TaxID=300843 RepID=A0AAW2JUX9_SESRA